MDDRRARATYLVYRALGAALQALPEAAADAAAAMVGTVMAQRRDARWNLRVRHVNRVLASTSPVVAPDPAVVARWARRSYRAYARYWVEGARLSGLPSELVNSRFLIERGWENLTEPMAEGRGVVMVLPHVGSWEWGGAFLASSGYPMTTVAEPLEPPEMYAFFVREREALGLRIVSMDADAGRVLLKTLRAGGLVGLLCERDLSGNGIPVEFFGEQTTFPAGPATLALRTGAALVAAAVYSGPGREHTAVITPPLDTTRRATMRADAGRVTQDIARHLEQLIRFAPEQWHVYQPIWPSDPPSGAGGT